LELKLSGGGVKTGGYSFEDLEVYKAASCLRKKFYDLSKSLPDSEKYGLQTQICRAAVSVTNNIAEGHGRFHYPDRIRFLLISRGSLEELIDDLNVCLDEGYCHPDQIKPLKMESYQVEKLINGYLSYLRKQQSSQ
jgi:four helix bundle protein